MEIILNDVEVRVLGCLTAACAPAVIVTPSS